MKEYIKEFWHCNVLVFVCWAWGIFSIAIGNDDAVIMSLGLSIVFSCVIGLLVEYGDKEWSKGFAMGLSCNHTK